MTPRWRFLTRSYVEWLGLKHFMVIESPCVVGFLSEHACKPESVARISEGVHFEGALFIRESDGLAYRLSARNLIRNGGFESVSRWS